MGKVVLVDGHSILNRAFYGIPVLTNAEGLYTNAVYGFLNIMFKILDEETADYLAVAFDVHAPTFRHEMFDAYKGTRKGMPEELRSQVPLMKEVLHTMNIPTLEYPGYEADDILGTLGRLYEKMGHEVSIISGDRDLLQLATDHTKIRIPKTKMTGTEVEDYYAADVITRYGVTPTEFIDLKALMGDASDNIPGVPGIGEKTASKIIMAYHSIEAAHTHAEDIKPKKASENLQTYWDQAVMSKVLATIKTDCKLDFNLEEARIGDMMNEESYRIFKRLELKNILKRFDAQMSEAIAADYMAAMVMDDLMQCSGYLMQITKNDTVGLFYIAEEGFEGLSVSLNGQDAVWMPVNGFMTRGCLMGFVHDIVERAGCVCVFDLKRQLAFFEEDETSGIQDCSIAAYLLNPIKDSYTYDNVAQEMLGMTIPSRVEWLKKLSLKKAWDEQHHDLLHYLAYEAIIPALVWPVLKQKLEETEMMHLYSDIEMPLVYSLYEMEKAGICVEKGALAEYGEQLTGRIDALETQIYELAGEKFNIQSPKQLGVILFEKMNLPFAKKTKTGYSTSAEILDKLRSYDPIIGKILEYRQLTKLKSTYADGLAGYIQPDHRIHGIFNQTITATGRLSSTEPNLQNIPVRMELGRLIRKVFVPEEGCTFVNADYSQIELRVLAHMAGDENLIHAYKEAQDIHRMTASQVFHIPFDEVTPTQRSNAKAVNFGIVYGISSFSLSQDLSITKKEADEYIQQYFKTYPGIKAYLDQAIIDAKEKGYAVTMFGRRRPVPELMSSNFMQRAFGERIAMNSPIQGTAADIIKIAMVKVSRRLKKQNMKSRLILQIHDELLIEAVDEEIEQVKQLLKEEMEQAAELKVPLDVDMHTGHNWYELK